MQHAHMDYLLEEQFLRLRDGDMFYFENDIELAPHMSAIIDSPLTEVILRNTNINNMQYNSMYSEPEDQDMNCFYSVLSEQIILLYQ